MDLSIIIVNWNSKEYLRKCLGSILTTTQGLEFEIIVIDSASFDGCGEMLREEFPQVQFVQSQENLGFAKSNNLAFHSATGAFVLFINPDTEVLDAALNVLHSALKSLPNAGAVGAKLLNTDRTVQLNCIQSFPTILNQLLSAEPLRRRFPRLWGMAPLFEEVTKPQVVDVVSGACVMVPRGLLEKIGVFSEDYFMYSEDTDLSHKIRQAGYECYYVPEAAVIHYGGASSEAAPSNLSSIMMRESAFRFFKKTRGKYYGLVYRISMLVSALVRLVLLVVFFPLLQARRHRKTWGASFRKWKAILSWSLLRERWVNDH